MITLVARMAIMVNFRMENIPVTLLDAGRLSMTGEGGKRMRDEESNGNLSRVGMRNDI